MRKLNEHEQRVLSCMVLDQVYHTCEKHFKSANGFRRGISRCTWRNLAKLGYIITDEQWWSPRYVKKIKEYTTPPLMGNYDI